MMNYAKRTEREAARRGVALGIILIAILLCCSDLALADRSHPACCWIDSYHHGIFNRYGTTYGTPYAPPRSIVIKPHAERSNHADTGFFTGPTYVTTSSYNPTSRSSYYATG